MTKFIHKIGVLMAGVTLGVSTFTSCSEQIDDSNLYTFTGETVIDYLRSDSTLSDIAKISDYAGMSDRLSAYGTYTCFAPTNKAVEKYVQSLYDDAKNANHHALYAGTVDHAIDRLWKSEKRDSLCKDIIEAHVCGQKKTSNDLATGADITMMGGNTQTPKRVGDSICIDGTVTLIARDHEVENGVVHTIDNLFYRSTNYVIDEMENMGVYGIWCDALKATGLDEIMKETKRDKGISWFTIDPEAKYPFAEYPTTCKVGFTVFAEPDEVLKNKGINNLQDLAEKAKEWYQGCAAWYDYVNDNGIQISTGTDYTNQWNTLNMFLRYHILKYALSRDKLVYSYNELEELDVYEYVRTLLPHTMLKLTGVKSYGSVSSIWINRELNTPTLTDVPGNNMYKDPSSAYQRANAVTYSGIQVGGKDIESRQASNGYIHPISDVLTYNTNVPNKVLNERMRIDFMALLDESMTNNFRGYSFSDLSSRFGRNDKQIGAVRFPEGYFENMVIYNGESSRVYYLVKDETKTGNNGFNPGWDCWLDYQGDELFVRGAYDFAVKLPPVPKDGMYELRFGYVETGKRTMVQFSLGHSSDRSQMTPCDIPLDQRMLITSTTIGYTDPNLETSDYGAATDRAMHNRGWMRGPNYFSNFKKGEQGTARTNITRQPHIRRVVTKQYFRQGQDTWFRCKTAMPEDTEAEFELDYIELVPVNVYNNPELTEDVF